MIQRRVSMFLIMLTITHFLFGQSGRESKVKIESVNFFVLTTYAVSCEDFYPSFENTIKYKEIYSADTLRMLNSFLKKVKYSTKKEGFDVRAKFNYMDGFTGENSTICINNFSVMVNGRVVKKSKEFLSFLKSCLTKDQLL